MQVTQTALLSPADVLRRTADYFAEDPARWGREWYLNPHTGCRCLLGGIAYVLDPTGEQENPRLLPDEAKAHVAWEAIRAVQVYVFDVLGWQPPDVDDDPAPVLGDWNDEPQRTVDDVVAALRAAAGWSEARR